MLVSQGGLHEKGWELLKSDCKVHPFYELLLPDYLVIAELENEWRELVPEVDSEGKHRRTWQVYQANGGGFSIIDISSGTIDCHFRFGGMMNAPDMRYAALGQAYRPSGMKMSIERPSDDVYRLITEMGRLLTDAANSFRQCIYGACGQAEEFGRLNLVFSLIGYGINGSVPLHQDFSAVAGVTVTSITHPRSKTDKNWSIDGKPVCQKPGDVVVLSARFGVPERYFTPKHGVMVDAESVGLLIGAKDRKSAVLLRNLILDI